MYIRLSLPSLSMRGCRQTVVDLLWYITITSTMLSCKKTTLIASPMPTGKYINIPYSEAIHQENIELLSRLSAEELAAERDEVMQQLGMDLASLVMSKKHRKKGKNKRSVSMCVFCLWWALWKGSLSKKGKKTPTG